MTVTFDQGYLKAVAEGVNMLAQQKITKIAGLVRQENKAGDYVFFDTLAALSAMDEITTNKATTSLEDVVRARRGLRNKLYIKTIWTDKLDEIKSMNDPASHFAESLAAVVGREKDDILINAAFGSALTGADGGGSQALPSGQKVAVTVGNGGSGDVGLNVEKIIETARIMDAAEISSEGRFLVVGAKPMSQLLNTTKATSADYNSVRALVSGQIDTFMGFKFIKSQRLGVDSNSDLRVLAFQKDALIFNSPKALEVKAGENMDKNYLYQAAAIMSGAAVRVEDAGVVEIACDPTA